MAQMKTAPKLILIALAAGGLFFGLRAGMSRGLIPTPAIMQSVVPKQATLATFTETGADPAVKFAGLPTTQPVQVAAPQVRAEMWAWNAQIGWIYANGGRQTTSGSLMQKHGVNLVLRRQDDNSQMQNDLFAFAQALANGNAQPSEGVHFIAIMGDGAGAFLEAINPRLKRLGPDYIAEIVGSGGFSRGEDKFMAEPKVKDNPSAVRGTLVAGVLRDGDWNIAMKWAGDNGICNNPDETTYDPNCLNWVNTDSYVAAAEKYVANYCEARTVVKSGIKTGEQRKVCVNGVVTWTPGDVTIAKKRGGLISVVSTKQYRTQMPNTIIGIRHWNQQNHIEVENMLAAVFEAGDQIRNYPQALRRAAEASVDVYCQPAGTCSDQEQTAGYWEKYYIGVTEPDATGMPVDLGGSAVNNLADNLQLFGLTPGSANAFKATYTTFGDIVIQQYPKLVSTYPSYSEVVNLSYLQAIAGRTQVTKADAPTFSSAPITSTVSRKSWNITFQTGSASFTPQASADLQRLLNDLVIAGGAAVEIHGHTDNTGTVEANQALSERRAYAVKQWLEQQAPTNFPQGRVRFFAHGQTNPVASNASEDGRKQNRRVEIVLGN